MNCYTVTGGSTHLGIALSHDEARRTLCLVLGKKTGQAGRENKTYLELRNPASHVLVAGGVRLMRTATLLQVGEKNPEFVFAKAKHGLKADTTDPRALVFVDYLSTSSSFGYLPKSFHSTPVFGFEVLDAGILPKVRGLYRVQGLVVLEPNQHFGYYDQQKKVGYIIAYDFNGQQDRFPLLSCIPAEQFRAREKKQLITV